MRVATEIASGVFKLTGLAVVTASVGLASAAEISQKSGYSGDSAGSSSFVNGTGWADGQAPKPGNDYMWKQGSLRTPDNVKSSATDTKTYRFAGDKLSLASGNTAAIAQKTCGENVLTVVDNLVAYNNTSWTQSCGIDTLARIGGKITVNGTGTFWFKSAYGSGGCRYDMQILSSLVGASGCSVSVSQLSYVKAANVTDPIYPARSYIRIAGDNREFLGKWKVSNVNPSSGYPYIDEEGIVLVLESANALGGDTGSMVPDALQLSNHGGLAVSPDLCSEGPFAPSNKGLTIGARGGRLTTVGDETWSLGMPIAGGSDKNLFKSGRGTVRLCGTYAAGPVTVEEGALVWASASAVPSSVTVCPGAAFYVRADETKILSGAFVSGVELAFDAANKTCARLELDATCTMPSGQIPVRLDAALSTDDTSRYEVLTIPVAVRKVVAADFVDMTEKPTGAPTRWFSVTTEDGVQHVMLYQNPPVVVMSEATTSKNPDRGNGQWFFTDAKAWSDGLVPSPANDYRVDKSAASSLRTSGGSTGTVVFPGNSLTLEKPLAHKNAELVVTNFILKADSLINAAGNAGRVSQVVSGTMIIDSSCTDSHPAKVEGSLAQNIDIASAISGTGVLSFQPYDSSKVTINVAASHLSGDNSRFVGRILATSWYVNNNQTNVGQTLSFESPLCLGGPLAAFDYRSIHIGRCCTLRATDTMTLDTANRGLYFEPEAAIDVAVGTLTVVQPLRKVGVLHKVGAGTLALGGDISFGSSGQATASAEADRVVQVDEGGLAVASRDSVRELSLKVAAAGSLVVSPEVTDEDVRTNGLYSEKTDAIVLTDATLAVNVAASAAFWESHTSFSIPICTVPKALGDQLAGKIKMIRHKGYNGVVTRQELAGDMSRFVLDVAKAGLVVVFR